MIAFTPIASSSSGNCYLLASGEHRLLIDAGISIARIRKALDYTLSSIDGCLCDHMHLDHAKAIPDLLKNGINCYATVETFDGIKAAHHYRAHAIEPLKQFKVADYWTVLPFPAEHDCEGAVGFLVTDGEDKLCFLVDSYFVKYRFNNVGIFALGCNFSPDTFSTDIREEMKRRLLRAHMSLSNCIKMLKANDLSKTREIHLLHLSDSNSSEEMFRREVEAAVGLPVYVAAK